MKISVIGWKPNAAQIARAFDISNNVLQHLAERHEGKIPIESLSIAHLRRGKKLNQSDVARAWGVSRQRVSILCKRGMPLTSLGDAYRWMRSRDKSWTVKKF